MNDHSTSLFSISNGLDNEQEFILLQALVDQDESGDLLSPESSVAMKKRWTEISQKVSILQEKWSDTRLTIIDYRAQLAQQGLLSGLSCLSSFHDQFKEANLVLSSFDKEDIETCLASLCYFFSFRHLNDLRQASLASEIHLPVSTLWTSLHEQKNHLKNLSLSGTDLHYVQLSTWAADQKDLIHHLWHSQANLRHLEKILMPFNVLGLEIRSNTIVEWLVKLEEIMLKHGCPLPPTSMIEDSLDSPDLSDEKPPKDSELSTRGLTTSNSNISEWRKDEIFTQLEQIVIWFSLNEPSNPAPYFLRRAIQLGQADFLSLIQELFPESVAQFEKITGLRNKQC